MQVIKGVIPAEYGQALSGNVKRHHAVGASNVAVVTCAGIGGTLQKATTANAIATVSLILIAILVIANKSTLIMQ